MTIFEWLADIAGIEAPSLLEVIFVSCAILGGILFFIMMLLMLVGDILGGIGEAAGFDADIGSDLGFEMLSIQGLCVAIMMFGLTGMFGLSATGSDVAAVLFGGAGAAGGAVAGRGLFCLLRRRHSTHRCRRRACRLWLWRLRWGCG